MNRTALLCRSILERPQITQRELAAALDVSLGMVNKLVKEAQEIGWITVENGIYTVTDQGMVYMRQFRVDGALLLAAGFGSRFVPLTFETPKGLLEVFGERMIERQIRQLHAVGIYNIMIAVGYLKEKFEYLIDKYGVTLLYNPEYSSKNTLTTVYHARKFLAGKNVYILSSDHWMRENIFHSYECGTWYASVYKEGGTSEWCFSLNKKGKVLDVKNGGHDSWVMYGPVYLSAGFVSAFLPVLEAYYHTPGTEQFYWEHVYMEMLNGSAKERLEKMLQIPFGSDDSRPSALQAGLSQTGSPQTDALPQTDSLSQTAVPQGNGLPQADLPFQPAAASQTAALQEDAPPQADLPSQPAAASQTAAPQGNNPPHVDLPSQPAAAPQSATQPAPPAPLPPSTLRRLHKILSAEPPEMYANFQPSDMIYEFENLEELRRFDTRYRDRSDNEALELIAKVFQIPESEIRDIRCVKAGMTNQSFLFRVQDKSYICRIPGPGTGLLINRRQEAASFEAVQPMGFTEKVVYFDSGTGYKISEYYEGARNADPTSQADMSRCMSLLKRMHHSGIRVDHDFDIRERIEFYESLCKSQGEIPFEDYLEVRAHMNELMDQLDQLDRPRVFSHIDSVADNFLFLPDGQLKLIDLEYAGMCDPLIDVAMCAIYSYYDDRQVDWLIQLYLEREPDKEERTVIYSYVALGGFLWSLWTVYKHFQGQEFGEYSIIMYRYAKRYYRKVFQKSL